MSSEALLPLAVALALGLLVGFQRQLGPSHVAGIRTFAFVTLLGAVVARLSPGAEAWPIAGGLVGLSALLVVANAAKIRAGEIDPGLTTEVAALLMYGVGVLCVVGPLPLALVLGGTVALLLHGKERLHDLVARIGRDDVTAIMRFVLISLVVLPLLPDVAIDPWGVLSPFDVWRMVVLIVGIQLAAYVIQRLVGSRGGTLLAGLLGGTISSTATTLAAARGSRSRDTSDGLAAVVIVLASGVVFVRLGVEIAAIAPRLLPAAGLALALPALVLLGTGLLSTLRAHDDDPPALPQSNPAELRPAVAFAAIYAAVLVAVALAKERLGGGALYGVAVLGGLTDTDAITLSTARLFAAGRLDELTATRVVLVAALANLVFKAALAIGIGSRTLAVGVVWRFALALVAGLGWLALA